MIVCDFCGEPITEQPTVVFAGGTSRVDLHSECVPVYTTEAKKIKGKRPVHP
jgi:hypothetical protein